MHYRYRAVYDKEGLGEDEVSNLVNLKGCSHGTIATTYLFTVTNALFGI